MTSSIFDDFVLVTVLFGASIFGNFEKSQTASESGTKNNGTVFKLNIGAAPFVRTLTPSGGIGAEIVILGMNLTETTAVTFNGASATFTVVAPGEITARVPAGATTGTIQVTTPGGILSSNVPFKIP